VIFFTFFKKIYLRLVSNRKFSNTLYVIAMNIKIIKIYYYYYWFFKFKAQIY